ncbi:hypothetical protein CYLTODRAFT_421742 [Cylindrobasidium torrendii FP15055 ss-10]|uniref:Uncharacterized protein n=1 Tax=Cylindrobasidium torrendii FP15055 ss-10 TaxID=1314674 RepID=A0A0D7BCW1_9AGAR|nr:hypothetical protein CYLTODRAFT_421742 [Cylindrobasidium torrendii FP15055 ss-10]
MAALAKAFASFSESSTSFQNSIAKVITDYERRAEEAVAERDKAREQRAEAKAAQEEAIEAQLDAIAQRDKARDERDDAMEAAHAAQEKAQDWRQKSKQQENMIAHQNDKITTQGETIASLKRDLSHWRSQANTWQDHFLRAQERCAELSSMLDDLAYDRGLEPPSLTLAPGNDPARASDPATSRTPTRKRPRQSEASATPATNGQTRFIRRVHATYEVKTESDDDGPLSIPPVATTNGNKTPRASTAPTTVKTPRQTLRTAPVAGPSGSRKTPLHTSSVKHRGSDSESEQEEADDDDESMLDEQDELDAFAATNHDPKKSGKRSASATRPPPQSAKKRKVATPGKQR